MSFDILRRLSNNHIVEHCWTSILTPCRGFEGLQMCGTFKMKIAVILYQFMLFWMRKPQQQQQQQHHQQIRDGFWCVFDRFHWISNPQGCNTRKKTEARERENVNVTVTTTQKKWEVFSYCYLRITHLFALSMVNHFALIQFEADECESGYSTGVVSLSNT